MKLFVYTKPQFLLFVFLLLICNVIQAQKFKYSIPGFEADSIKKSFIVAGGSSTVLNNGEGEIIMNNSLTSYWLALHQFDQNSPILDRFRSTQFISDIYGFYGISESGKWDMGIHLRYSRTRIDNAATSSMFKVFNGSDNIQELIDANNGLNTIFFDQSIGAISSVGLRFRAAPLNLDPKLVFNAGFSIKTVTGEEKARQLAADRNAVDFGATYYMEINKQTFYFFGGTLQAFFPSTGVNDEYLFNTSVNFSLILRTLNNKFTFYPGLSYSLAFKPSQLASESHSLIRTTEFLFAFGGIQYAPTSKFNIFLTGGFPLISAVTNPQQEIVRQSYSNLNLGARFGF
ncbi:MAG: hypothetical protein R2828_32305 [Saprospiraceae bacterium]